MGVPKFYRFISERYPLINTKLDGKELPRIDNLYLDMNGIIHNCVRASPGNGSSDTKRYASSTPTVKSDDQIFLDVFKYIDNLVALVPPSKVLFLAVDGVAPRAKMNQQRARRFRSAKERADEHAKRLEEDPMYAAAATEPFDSNCITPGTEFMQKLTTALQYFVTKKVSEDKRWSRLDVILSGAETAGEGEHKIMEYIRAVRESGRMKPNTRHCVYGLDADLIMLGLVTHEPHFFILREKVDFGAYWKKKGGPRLETSLDTTVFGEFELLSIGILREYLALELGANGNDFLPNLPTLDIADGTLSVMLHLYKRLLPIMGGYLTEEGNIIPERLDFFFAKLGFLDKTVMRGKLEEQDNRRRRGVKATSVVDSDLDQLFDLTASARQTAQKSLSLPELKCEAAAIREKLHDEELTSMKQRYYSSKFGENFGKEGKEGVNELTQSYVEGIQWTLNYYTEGCRHWRWYYPFHYAPLASDIFDASSKLDLYKQERFVRDQPFLPFEQLLSVLPPVSSWCLPKPYRSLMTSPTSPIYDHYPEDFGYDMNGKRNDWEAVVLLPFVSEERLKRATASISTTALTEVEMKRNAHGEAYMYKYTPTWREEIQSPFGPRMPSFTSCAKWKIYFPFDIPDGQAFKAKTVAGTQPAGSNDSLADLPTLGMLQHDCRLEAIGVNIFGSPSKAQTLVLTMDFSSDKEEAPPQPNSSKKSKDLSLLEKNGMSVGAQVWHGYPWRMSGTVEYIATETVTKRAPATSEKRKSKAGKGPEIKPTNKTTLERDAQILLSTLMIKQGIELVNPAEIIGVRCEAAGLESPDGNDEENAVIRYDPHFVRRRTVAKPSLSAKGKQDSEERLSVGQEVLYVGIGPYFGHKCVVRSVQGNTGAKVEFTMPGAAAKEPAFGYRVVSISSNQKWMTLSKLASEVGMSVPIVDTFLGTIRVRLQSAKEEIDLGLGIKYIGRSLYIPGYARPDERQYYSFSEKTAELLREYRKAFPHLFETIEEVKQEEMKASNGKTRGNVMYSTRDLFGNGKKADDAARAASTWISVQAVAKLPLVSANSDVLTKETVEELEKHFTITRALQKEFEGTLPSADVKKRTRDVPRQSLLTGNEGLEWSLSAKAANSANAPVEADASSLRLGDRVVNRLGTSTVPFGLRGTVVGIHPTTGDGDTKTAHVEVVFDEGFIGGGRLSGRCSDGRGKAVEAHGLFVIRPDRDNQYYVKHYARIAARVAVMGKKEVDEKEKGRDQAVAMASMISYAQAVEGGIKGGASGSKTVIVGSGGENSDGGGNGSGSGSGIDGEKSVVQSSVGSKSGSMMRSATGTSGTSVNGGMARSFGVGNGPGTDLSSEPLDITSGAITAWMDEVLGEVKVEESALPLPSFVTKKSDDVEKWTDKLKRDLKMGGEEHDEEDEFVELWNQLQKDARAKRDC